MKMDMQTFVREAARTMPPEGVFHLQTANEINILHGAMGLTTEVGEIWECIYSTKPFDRVNMGEELGDCLWYVACLCREFAFTLPDYPNLELYSLTSVHNYTLEQITAHLTIESSKILDTSKKVGFYNKEIHSNVVEKLVHNTYSLIGQLVHLLQLDIDEIRFNNNAKLRVRFPEKFTNELANNRNLTEERTTLDN